MSKLVQCLLAEPHTPFVAIDFETADYEPDSACAVALVRVENLTIVERKVALLRPPRTNFVFTYVHGITWAAVKSAPTFADAWPDLCRLLDGARFLAAHNAGFDRNVLNACCLQARLAPPAQPIECTVKLARKMWRLPTNKLPSVCSYLQIPLQHHDAASDAEACARIVLAATATLRAKQTSVPATA